MTLNVKILSPTPATSSTQTSISTFAKKHVPPPQPYVQTAINPTSHHHTNELLNFPSKLSIFHTLLQLTDDGLDGGGLGSSLFQWTNDIDISRSLCFYYFIRKQPFTGGRERVTSYHLFFTLPERKRASECVQRTRFGSSIPNVAWPSSGQRTTPTTTQRGQRRKEESSREGDNIFRQIQFISSSRRRCSWCITRAWTAKGIRSWI